MSINKQTKKNNGITLIALVITIIVLLILAGVSIMTLTGDNGILTQASRVKEKTKKAEKEEASRLNSYEDIINDNIGIDWDTVLANAQKHPDQKTSTAIGVGTDGRAVNMDLWEYTLLEDGTYALNDSQSIAKSGTRTAGYTGNIVEGKIDGTIPQYIKNESDDNFIQVTSLQWAFYQNTDITDIPKLPDSVTNMYNTFNRCNRLIIVENLPNNVINMQGAFNGCTSLTTVKDLPDSIENMSWTFQDCINLTSVGELPNSVTNMEGTFFGCTSLINAPNIPNNVANMGSTFQNCTNLTTIKIIPNSVINMHSTFQNCTNLTTIKIIPNSVINMRSTFNGCTNLQGEITINANLTGAIVDEENNIKDYQGTLWNACMADGITLKVSGSCPVLKEMISATNSLNITLAE